MVVCRTMLKRQSCCPRGLALASRTPHEGLGLGLDTSGLGLGLGLGLERKVLALALARLGKAKVKTLPPPTIQATWLLYVYALLTLTVSHDSLPFLV